MKFYITNNNNQRLLYKIINRFGYECDIIENYKGEDAYFIINTQEVHDEYWTNFLKNDKLIFLLDDGPEGYPQILRLEYTRFYNVLDEFKVNRNRGIICYNNAYNKGVVHYNNHNITMLYIPTFALNPFNSYLPNKNKIIPKYDYSYLVRNGKKHKEEGYFKIRNKNLDNVFITYKKNRNFIDDSIFDDINDNLHDEWKFHLKSEVYYNSKIQIIAESEYYSQHTNDNPNFFEEMLHLSEKTWRNISYGLPFVLISSRGSLYELKRLGFKTFDTLIDESYDTMDDSIRMDYAIDAAKELLKHHNTYELNNIIEYNKARMYDDIKMKNLLETESFIPLRKYVKDLEITE